LVFHASGLDWLNQTKCNFYFLAGHIFLLPLKKFNLPNKPTQKRTHFFLLCISNRAVHLNFNHHKKHIMKNIFTPEVSAEVIARINHLNPTSQPQWGKMNVAQMLAHCNVTYDLAFNEKHKKATGIKKWVFSTFLKPIVCGEKPYAKNSRTAPVFLITDVRVFETEKRLLIEFVTKAQELGDAYFNGKESVSFGNLTTQEWNNMFYKHLDHHLTQFGV
jgi:hypothetical protein